MIRLTHSSAKQWSDRRGIEPGTPEWESFVLSTTPSSNLGTEVLKCSDKVGCSRAAKTQVRMEMKFICQLKLHIIYYSVALEIVAQFTKFSFVIVIPHLICVFNSRRSGPNGSQGSKKTTTTTVWWISFCYILLNCSTWVGPRCLLFVNGFTRSQVQTECCNLDHWKKIWNCLF